MVLPGLFIFLIELVNRSSFLQLIANNGIQIMAHSNPQKILFLNLLIYSEIFSSAQATTCFMLVLSELRCNVVKFIL